MTRIRSRRRPRRKLLVVGALIVVAVVSMLAFSALSGDQPPSEENQPGQEEFRVDPVLTPAGGIPEDAEAENAEAPADQQQPEE